MTQQSAIDFVSCLWRAGTALMMASQPISFKRRWERFGLSGAKLIWGGEAVSVRPDGRANPRQLMILDETVGALASLREHLVKTHETHFGSVDDLLIGLQLTHSGRFARPL